jgi:hypothetical protein
MRLRQAARALRATPGITVASIVILALGIGASTAVFSVVNGLLLRPLPVTAQDRLVRVSKIDVVRRFDHYTLTYPEYLEWSRRSREFESLAAFWAWGTNDGLLLGSGEPAHLKISPVSGNFFEVLGASSHVGRTLRSEDDRASGVPPLVLSHRAWRERFGSDPAVVGRTLPVRLADRTSFLAVGVMPGFDLFGRRGLTPIWPSIGVAEPGMRVRLIRLAPGRLRRAPWQSFNHPRTWLPRSPTNIVPCRWLEPLLQCRR